MDALMWRPECLSLRMRAEVHVECICRTWPVSSVIHANQVCGHSSGKHRSGSGGNGGGGGGDGSGFHVLLTSYESRMGRHDRPRLARLRYCHIILDEGHRLKNAGCKLNSELAHYRATSRLLLTGKAGARQEMKGRRSNVLR